MVLWKSLGFTLTEERGVLTYKSRSTPFLILAALLCAAAGAFWTLGWLERVLHYDESDLLVQGAAKLMLAMAGLLLFMAAFIAPLRRFGVVWTLDVPARRFRRKQLEVAFADLSGFAVESTPGYALVVATPKLGEPQQLLSVPEAESGFARPLVDQLNLAIREGLGVGATGQALVAPPDALPKHFAPLVVAGIGACWILGERLFFRGALFKDTHGSNETIPAWWLGVGFFAIAAYLFVRARRSYRS